MMKTKLLATAFAAAALSFATAHADGHGDMEKCKVVNAEGVGMIKEHKAACSTASNSCSGHNKAGDPEAWILVPAGECVKVNAGDYTGLSDEMKDKIEMEEKTAVEEVKEAAMEVKGAVEAVAK